MSNRYVEYASAVFVLFVPRELHHVDTIRSEMRFRNLCGSYTTKEIMNSPPHCVQQSILSLVFSEAK